MRLPSLALALSITPLFAACDSPGGMSDPALPSAPAFVSAAAAAKEHPVEMLDQCDPDSFNFVIGPGTCISGHSGITFDKFIAQLTANQVAPAWRNAPNMLTASFGSTLEAINRGGEVHTFTRVTSFGGGVVPFLNEIAGTPIPAPECLAAPPAEYIGPGGVDADHIDAHGTLYYQCCIHPWMRTTVTVK